MRLFTERLIVETEPGVEEERCAAVLSLRPAGEDAAADAEARRLLEGFGPVELACLEHVVAPFDSEADYLVDVDEDVHALCSFTAHAVPRLRELGFEVEIAPDYPYQVVGCTADWYADVDEDDRRPDWFSLELGVDVDGERVNLMPAMLDLIEKTSGSGLASIKRVPARLRALPVGPNRWVTLDPERLARILRVLYDLHTGARARLDAIRFPAAAAALLGEIDSALSGGSGGPVRWRGAAGAIERGRALAGEPTFCPTPVALKAVLRPYQHQGLAWMQHLRAHDAGGVLADDMGLGKTLQTIAHLAIEKEARRMDLPTMIVVPTSLVGNWNRELSRFAPHLRTCTWHGAARRKQLSHVIAPSGRRLAPLDKLRRAEVIVTTYPVLCRDLDVFEDLELHYVILDEAQAIKNPRSQAAAAAKALKARHRLCLTGTPIENNLEELWSIFDFAMPGLLGSAEAFRERYRNRVEQEGDGERLEALRERVAPYVLRRVKEAVATELPPKTILVRPIEIEGDQRDLYESIRIAAHGDVRKAIRERGFSGSVLAVLDALMKLRQVCCDPRLVAVPGARDVKRSAKLDALMSLLERQLGQGRRILVFSQYTRMLAIISENLLARGVRHLTLTGETVDRQARVDAFEQGKAEVFLISLKAGGTGLNLTSADTVVHYDPWWNAAAQAQATDRAHRIGQTKPVFVHNLIVAGSVEERMLRLQERKKHLADVLLGTGGEHRAALSEQDVDDLFAPLSDSSDVS